MKNIELLLVVLNHYGETIAKDQHFLDDNRMTKVEVLDVMYAIKQLASAQKVTDLINSWEGRCVR